MGSTPRPPLATADPLDFGPIYRRLDWAAGHGRRVRDLSDAWAASAMVSSTTHDPERGVWVYRAEVVGEPPDEIALALGDALHQGRATLDNLIGVLRGRASGESAFRIDTDPLTFDLDPWRPRGRLRGVPPWGLAALREAQPFPGNPWRTIGDNLANLHHLAIIDRHRTLLVAAALIDLDKTGAATSHPSETNFGLHHGGRVLTLEYPAGAHVTPSTGVQIVVREERLRWTGEGAGYPLYPQAADLADYMVGTARRVVDEVWRAAAIAEVQVR